MTKVVTFIHRSYDQFSENRLRMVEPYVMTTSVGNVIDTYTAVSSINITCHLKDNLYSPD